MSNMPADEMLPLLFGIEKSVVGVYEEYTKLADKDVAFVYDQLKSYYKNRSQGKEQKAPTSSLASREALFKAVLRAIGAREKLGGDKGYINSSFENGGRPVASLEAFYVIAFNHLRRSVRRWSKMNGRTGYLRFVKEQLEQEL